MGIIAAFLGSISGTGGGFVAIPVLYYLGLPPHSAIAASKFMVFVNSAISIIVYLRDVKFPPKLYFSVAAPMAPMAYLGAYLVVIIPQRLLIVIVGTTLLTGCIRLLLTGGARGSEERHGSQPQSPSLWGRFRERRRANSGL